MYLKSEDLTLLKEIKLLLYLKDSYGLHYERLCKLIDRLNAEHKKDNEKMKLVMREKRKVDKSYGHKKYVKVTKRRNAVD